MSDIDLKVHYSSLQEASATLRNAAKDLADQLDNLRHRVEAVSQTWDGEAQQAFVQADTVWRQRTQHIQTVLGDVADRLDRAHASYHATDKKASSYFHA
ncbi:WXG100 family type VII secretion target [Streptantibioticus ferralitis]|uniref:ESAT-6-like protein n=1 Tax=Streptantibioticus ferralitis TaxID=236510 RepID=A0ABT5ZA86_9ACTN|nr:WXG100 family type VII secretion target [Streptantibioticus ferralitis]MDF2260752.1 WXG100 family type VII secretion target [Streptantibioticus ferralitis]